MTAYELEVLARHVIERVKRGQLVEDSRVELKRTWPEPVKAAPRLAAHANAARGESIVWIVGLDEEADPPVFSIDATETSTWYASLRRHFDEGWAPPCLQDLVLSVENRTIVVFEFRTDGAPYVCLNPKGGEPSRWVPWREATGTHAAGRRRLLELLIGQSKLPELDVLEGQLYSLPVQPPTSGDPPAISTVARLNLLSAANRTTHRATTYSACASCGHAY
jgi:hypothetical protein